MNARNTSTLATTLRGPWLSPWPSDELEQVKACPVCNGTERGVLHKELVDNVFSVAPGKWTLYQCAVCRSAYLDPRPSPKYMCKAYGTYYTHLVGIERDNATHRGVFRRLWRIIANGYLNQRYGTQLHPASCLGSWVVKLLPRQRQALDFLFRYLPKPSQDQHLLDIGCGNGNFLISAREAGWHVTGIEPDPKAAAAARQRGVDVIVGTVELLAGESDYFDAITLSHVIEHVHEPKQLLEAVHRLLKPGGLVYIDTPNIQSHGAELFGANWRGIETPRHLVLFNNDSLKNLLFAAGFESIKHERRTAVRQHMYLSSLRIAAGHSPHSSAPVKLGWLERARLNLSLTKTDRLEFITLTARKIA